MAQVGRIGCVVGGFGFVAPKVAAPVPVAAAAVVGMDLPFAVVADDRLWLLRSDRNVADIADVDAPHWWHPTALLALEHLFRVLRQTIAASADVAGPPL